ncbi:radical SAM enzyme [Artomyces pyxidatus]|uniref:Radical SAM enzyme n=1 Tax=Artomyces pyxidatus TaxID=48021 RepID=A0ACB8SNH9_9AGAM|nr:radical SAM enzyme [Artomyces pyxidatus]
MQLSAMPDIDTIVDSTPFTQTVKEDVSLDDPPIVDINTRIRDTNSGRLIPISVNYFPHRRCNYRCGFCFHTDKNSFSLPLEKAKEGLKLLADAGMEKLNISGGEPFLQAHFLGEILRYAKVNLGISTGVICNGSKVTQPWLSQYGKYLDYLGVSCDSFDEDTNILIGRTQDGKTSLQWRILIKVSEWCREHKIKFKMNTVVNAYNWEEDMGHALEEIKPDRWKVFQVLLLDGENAGKGAIRNAEPLLISREQFQVFLDRHKDYAPVAEDNDAMENSYLLLDEEMRFLNCQGGKKVPGRSIFDVGVDAAFQDAGWEPETFVERGGIFEWSKDTPLLEKPHSYEW